MKNLRKVNILLVIVLMIGMTTIGCGDKNNSDNNDNNIISKTNNNNDSSEESTPVESEAVEDVEAIMEHVSAEIKEVAEAEGISEKELAEMEKGFIKIGAEKNSLSEKDYVAQIESSGHTVLGEWKVAADYMGVSLKEMYKYEKDSLANMTDEQKANLSGLASAVQEAQEAVTHVADSEGINATSSLTGIYQNDTGVIRESTMSEEALKEQYEFGVYKITQDNTDEYSRNFVYTSDKTIDELILHFDELVLNTEKYMKMLTPNGDAALLQGTVNGTVLYITVDQSQGGMATVEIYNEVE